MSKNPTFAIRWIGGFIVLSFIEVVLLSAQIEAPKPQIKGLNVSLFSSEPDIVTPTGIAVDRKGRVFCIESHTHFRPDNYDGPKADRIRLFEDTNNDGKADRISTFFEGTTATMNLAFAPDGSLFVATRAKIIRLRDTNGDNQADQNELVIDLQTEGNYPHNGLSGLAFDNGKLHFGFGENLGVDYKLKGTDGTTLKGGGEGGNIYRCNLDGSKLERIATGFWNPFGLAFDRTGNLFCIDNDPDWRPPCRLLHIVEGGDYGYRFSHGRRGTHPFTAWFGELPGTLGMVSGTGEAPSGILRCDDWSGENRDAFLSTSWGIHSIEKFVMNPRGASFVSQPETILKGGKDFRPVGIAQAPDGSIYVSDWCKRSYELHGHGRIWKLKFDKINSASAKQLQLPKQFPFDSTDVVTRQKAAQYFGSKQIDFPKAIQAAISPLEKATLIRRSKDDKTIDTLLLVSLLGDEDPFIRQAARFALSNERHLTRLSELRLPEQKAQRLGLALIFREHSSRTSFRARLRELLEDDDPEVRFVAIRWIGEERLVDFKEQLQSDIQKRPLTGRLFESYLAALDFIEQGRKGAEFEKAEASILANLLDDPNAHDETLVVALRKLQSVNLRDEFNNNHSKLKLDTLTKLLEHQNKVVVRETIQTISQLSGAPAQNVLRSVKWQQEKFSTEEIAYALIGLNPENEKSRSALILSLFSSDRKIQTAAAQVLMGVSLTEKETQKLSELAEQTTKHPVNRLLTKEKPNQSNSAWIESIKSKIASADESEGRLIFFNNRFSQCAKCHQIDGRGGMIGPDLSNVSGMSVERLLESITEPSKEIAPRHTPWLVETYDGRSITGVLVAERGENQSYADSTGKIQTVKFDEIERKKAVAKSIMPDKLLDRFTDSEVAALVKYLISRR